MKRRIVAIALLWAVPTVSLGAVVNLRFAGGGTSQDVAPGKTINVEVVLDLEGEDGFAAFDAQLRDSAGYGEITWTKREWGGDAAAETGPVGDHDKMATKIGGFPSIVPAEGTDPDSSAGVAVAIGVLGGRIYSQADIEPWVERLTLKVSAAANHSPYTISLENALIDFTGDGRPVPLRIGTAVTIPEPAGLLLSAIGGLFMCRRRA